MVYFKYFSNHDFSQNTSFALQMKGIRYIILLSIGLAISCDKLTKNIGNALGLGGDSNLAYDTVLYSKSTDIVFRDTFIDIGNVKEGKEYQIVYHYQNAGENPLMLFSVSPSCGCTIAEFSRDPLRSGGQDSIVAKFDSKDKQGSYQKNIKVHTNTVQKSHDLYFKVNVTP